MKQTCKSPVFLLGAWLLIMLSGYFSSRVSLFAAGGKLPCDDCQYCQELTSYWDSTSNDVFGWVDQLFLLPVFYGLEGTKNGAILDVYAAGCNNAGYPVDVSPTVTLDVVSYDIADVTCNQTVPLPKGRYMCDDADKMNFFGLTTSQTQCVNTD